MKTIKRLKTSLQAACAAFILTAGAGNALAAPPAPQIIENPCKDLDQDEAWKDLEQQLTSLVEQGKDDEANALAAQMSARCSRAPIVNFIQAQLLERQGNQDEAKRRYQEASQYTYEFAVSAEDSKKIWYKRYEIEYPERTEETIQKLVDEKLAIQSQLAAAQASLEDYKLSSVQKLADEYRTALWTGTGIGIAGIAMAAAGVSLIITLSNDEKYAESGTRYQIDPKYTTGWALLGVGLAATLSGAIVAGIFGYKLTDMDEHDAYAVQITPTGAMFSMTF